MFLGRKETRFSLQLLSNQDKASRLKLRGPQKSIRAPTSICLAHSRPDTFLLPWLLQRLNLDKCLVQAISCNRI